MVNNFPMRDGDTVRKKSHTIGEKLPIPQKKELEKYDFEKMKAAATSDDALVRKTAFLEYFQRFNEFPSYLFDNERQIDARLAQTMRDLAEDEGSSKELLDGIAALRNRLPSWS